MKILITNHSLNSYGGTETWTITMGEELERLGHTVHVYPADGRDNITPFDRYDESHYDLALVNHNICLEEFRDADNIDRIIFTSHGVIPDLEQPVNGADFYVSISEEVRDNLTEQGYDSAIIRNPIDMDKFKPTREINSKLSNVVFMSNYQGDALKTIQRACEGLNLRVWGKDNQTNDVVSEFNWADLVIGLARTAYEAMSMNRNVIIYDHNGADGFASPESVFDYRKKNCSGRTNAYRLDADDLENFFSGYDPDLKMRPYIRFEHDVKNIVEQYLLIARYV